MAARALASFRLEHEPAPVQNTAAPVAPRPEPAGRARPPRIGRLLGLPLDDHQLHRLAELEELVGPRYLGWGREGAEGGRQPDGSWREPGWAEYFVDVLAAEVDRAELKADGSGAGVERYCGESLHAAIGAALRAARGER